MSKAGAVLVTIGTAAPLFVAGCVTAAGHVAYVPTPFGLTDVEKYEWEQHFRKRTRRLGRWMAWGTVAAVVVAIAIIAVA